MGQCTGIIGLLFRTKDSLIFGGIGSPPHIHLGLDPQDMPISQHKIINFCLDTRAQQLGIMKLKN